MLDKRNSVIYNVRADMVDRCDDNRQVNPDHEALASVHKPLIANRNRLIPTYELHAV
jgi:ferredoxin-thioredoxin reductase catalytic subunit